MSDEFYLKNGDTSPVLLAILSDEDGEPVDLVESDVWLRLQEPRGGETVIESGVTVTDPEEGRVHYHWGALEDDRNLSGRYRADFVVEYPDGAQETFPNDGFHDVVITD
ncbi:phage baseplate upper protein [Halobacteria archaeon AArc-curdl1]|uniref:Phage baseplate upper protein n=1 Tax=Natronosalvus hydrolyticus TaxID=2979988 RepID=A0AAP2ZBM2_9EURY|nr:phage baseplate upper protein [Halobacteria archaeon AArc-curdl1]